MPSKKKQNAVRPWAMMLATKPLALGGTPQRHTSKAIQTVSVDLVTKLFDLNSDKPRIALSGRRRAFSNHQAFLRHRKVSTGRRQREGDSPGTIISLFVFYNPDPPR